MADTEDYKESEPSPTEPQPQVQEEGADEDVRYTLIHGSRIHVATL